MYEFEEYDDDDDLDEYFSCPNCGADVPWNAAACPECGSDDETGWSEEAELDYLFNPTGGYGYGDDDVITKPKMPMWQKIVSLLLAYILASPLALLFEPSSTGFALLTTILLIGIVYFLVIERMGGNPSDLFLPQRSIYYNRLMRRAQGDEALVERLIAFEKKRYPDATRAELERTALRRWERDNR